MEGKKTKRGRLGLKNLIWKIFLRPARNLLRAARNFLRAAVNSLRAARKFSRSNFLTLADPSSSSSLPFAFFLFHQLFLLPLSLISPPNFFLNTTPRSKTTFALSSSFSSQICARFSLKLGGCLDFANPRRASKSVLEHRRADGRNPIVQLALLDDTSVVVPSDCPDSRRFLRRPRDPLALTIRFSNGSPGLRFLYSFCLSSVFIDRIGRLSDQLGDWPTQLHCTN